MLSANFYVNNNTGGYFNFQAETTIGETWSMDCFMNDDGSIEFSTGGGGTVFLESTYPFDTWFNITMNINLTLNQWQVMIDNQVVGTFENTINQVASFNLYLLVEINIISTMSVYRTSHSTLLELMLYFQI